MKYQRKSRKELKATVTFLEADNTSARRHHGELASVDVRAIRQRIGLSQSAFADSIGFPEGALMNWEQGRRQPSGLANVLLALLAKKVQSYGGALSCGAAQGSIGAGAHSSEHDDRKRSAGRSWADFGGRRRWEP